MKTITALFATTMFVLLSFGAATAHNQVNPLADQLGVNRTKLQNIEEQLAKRCPNPKRCKVKKKKTVFYDVNGAQNIAI